MQSFDKINGPLTQYRNTRTTLTVTPYTRSVRFRVFDGVGSQYLDMYDIEIDNLLPANDAASTGG